jgi:hypothetical protein
VRRARAAPFGARGRRGGRRGPGAAAPASEDLSFVPARLKEFRAAPARVATLVPPLALVAGGGGSALRSALESLVGAAQHKAASIGKRAHAAAELATGQKVAAVAASAAAPAGGGTAVDHFANHEPARPPPTEKTVEAGPVKEETQSTRRRSRRRSPSSP